MWACDIYIRLLFISHDESSMSLYVFCADFFLHFPFLCWSFQKRPLVASFRKIYLYMKTHVSKMQIRENISELGFKDYIYGYNGFCFWAKCIYVEDCGIPFQPFDVFIDLGDRVPVPRIECVNLHGLTLFKCSIERVHLGSSLAPVVPQELWMLYNFISAPKQPARPLARVARALR